VPALFIPDKVHSDLLSAFHRAASAAAHDIKFVLRACNASGLRPAIAGRAWITSGGFQ
jgi:hypothetical protein